MNGSRDGRSPGAKGTSISTTSDPAQYGYAGMQLDLEAGLYHTKNRDYDSSTGRWLQQDPIWPMGGSNPYDYAQNNPLRFTDPLGLLCDEAQALQAQANWWRNAATSANNISIAFLVLSLASLKGAPRVSVTLAAISLLAELASIGADLVATSRETRAAAAQAEWEKTHK